MDKITIVREEAEINQETEHAALAKLKQITLAMSLLNQVKNTDLSYKVQSITQLLQNLHGHFVSDTKTISVKQQELLRKVQSQKFGSITKPDMDMDKIVKRFGQFLEVKMETQKYRTLSNMMNKALDSIQHEVDGLLEREIQKRKKPTKS